MTLTPKREKQIRRTLEHLDSINWGTSDLGDLMQAYDSLRSDLAKMTERADTWAARCEAERLKLDEAFVQQLKLAAANARIAELEKALAKCADGLRGNLAEAVKEARAALQPRSLTENEGTGR